MPRGGDGGAADRLEKQKQEEDKRIAEQQAANAAAVLEADTAAKELAASIEAAKWISPELQATQKVLAKKRRRQPGRFQFILSQNIDQALPSLLEEKSVFNTTKL